MPAGQINDTGLTAAMRWSRRSVLLPFVFVSCVLWGQASETQTAPHVDERVELLSIVFRLAGNPEYNMNSLPKYSQQIDSYFAPYTKHAVVQMAQALRAKRGVSFDAVMAMAISVSEAPGLKPLVPFKNGMPEARWGGEGEAFLRALRDFYRDSKFEEFYAAHQGFYRGAEARFAATLREVDFGWYPRFYGSAADLKYHLILGMNNGGGNYGPRLDLPDGRPELFSIIGCWTHDDAGDPTYPAGEAYLPTIIHEFNHSFVNPPVHKHWSEFHGAEQVLGASRARCSAWRMATPRRWWMSRWCARR